MIETPNCPMCGELPKFVLDDGHQNFCGNDACPVLAWDSHVDRETLLAEPWTMTDDPVVVIDGVPVSEAELDLGVWTAIAERERRNG